MVDAFLFSFRACGFEIAPPPIEEYSFDPDDRPFYEAFLAIRDFNGFLITGNLRHYPSDPRILLASDFLKTRGQKC